MDRIEKGISEGNPKKEQKLYKVLLHKRTDNFEVIRGLQLIARFELQGSAPVIDSLISRQNSDLSLALVNACLSIKSFHNIPDILQSPLLSDQRGLIIKVLALRLERELQEALAMSYLGNPQLQNIIHAIMADQPSPLGIIEACIIREGDDADISSLLSYFQEHGDEKLLQRIATELGNATVNAILIDRFCKLLCCLGPHLPYGELLQLIELSTPYRNKLILGSLALLPHEDQLQAIWQYRISLSKDQMPLLIPHLMKWDYYSGSLLLLTIADSLQNNEGAMAYQAYLGSTVSHRIENAFRYLNDPHSMYYDDSRGFFQAIVDNRDEVLGLHDIIEFFHSSDPEGQLCLAGEVFQFLEHPEIDEIFLELVSLPSDSMIYQEPKLIELREFASKQVIQRSIGTGPLFYHLFLSEDGGLYQNSVVYFDEPRGFALPRLSQLENLSIEKQADFLGFCHNLNLGAFSKSLIEWYATKPLLAGNLNHWLRHYSVSELRSLFQGYPGNSTIYRLPYLNLIAEKKNPAALEELRKYQNSSSNRIHLRALQLMYTHPAATIEDFKRDFHHSDPTIQFAAIQAMRRYPVNEIVSHLDRQLHRDNPDVRMIVQELLLELLHEQSIDNIDKASLYYLRGAFRLENGEVDLAHEDASIAQELNPESDLYSQLVRGCELRLQERVLQSYWAEFGSAFLKTYLVTNEQEPDRELDYPDTTASTVFPLRNSVTSGGIRYTLLNAYYSYDIIGLPEYLQDEFDITLVLDIGIENCSTDTLLQNPTAIEVEGKQLTDSVLQASRAFNRMHRKQPGASKLAAGTSSRFYLLLPSGMVDEDSLLTLRFQLPDGNPAQRIRYVLPIPGKRSVETEDSEHLEGIFENQRD